MPVAHSETLSVYSDTVLTARRGIEGRCGMPAGSGMSRSRPRGQICADCPSAASWRPRRRSVLAGQHEHRNPSCGRGLGVAELRILRDQFRPQLGAGGVVEFLR